MTETQLPFYGLVRSLRESGFALTPEQYARFRQALLLGFGSENIGALRQLCRLLWVKPSTSYDAAVFDRVFDQFVKDLQQQQQRSPSLPDEPPVQPGPLPRDLGEYPVLPPRVFPDESDEESEPAAETQVPTAIATSSTTEPRSVVASAYRLTPTERPVGGSDLQRLWSVLRYPLALRRQQELDVEATIARMERYGVDCDPVLRPLVSRRSHVVVFVDRNNAMIPFAPVIDPILQAVTAGRITPAQIYRFTTVPLEFVYPWEQPTMVIPLDQIFSQLHRQRTIAIILSDAGAASRIYNQERVIKTNQFLERLAPCVQQVVWLNPLSSDRWPQSSAIAIAEFLQGRMYPIVPETMTAIVGDRHRRFLPTVQPVVMAGGGRL